jgi:hypothetical protein
MNERDFQKLLKGVREGGEIMRGERAPAREHNVDSTMIKGENFYQFRYSYRVTPPVS